MVQVHVPSRTLLIPAADPFAIREVIHNSKTIEHDTFNVAVKHDVENTRILRNMGFEAPSPINAYYDWPGLHKPFDHQRVIAEFMTMHHRAFNLCEPGTGKTYSSLWAADWLINEGRVRKVLVIAPLSTIEDVWMKDIFKILMHRSAVKVYGSRERRLSSINADVDFYVINKDGITIKPVRDALRARKDIDLIIVDEGSFFRNPDTDLFRSLEILLRPDQRVWWLTGTPMPNSPADVWSQCKIINPTSVPKFYGSFKRTVMMPHPYIDGKSVPRPDAKDIAFKAMQPAIRFKKSDVLSSLPPVTQQDRSAELSKEQKEAFKTMKNAFVADLKKADQEGVKISAVNAADKVNKLRQILCGTVMGPDGEYVTLPHGPRTQVLIETIELASAKVLVIVPFKGIIRDLETELTKKGYSVGVLNGDVSITERSNIITAFKTTSDPHVLLCHPRVMAHGLNLVEADTTIFYGPIFSNDEYQQVIERFNRMGQVNPMTIYRIGAHPIEWEIYKTLDERGKMQDTVLNMYRDMLAMET